MSGCGSCSSCGSGEDKAQEYKNLDGKSAVKCIFCENEIVFDRLPLSRKVKCNECGTVVVVVPLLLN